MQILLAIDDSKYLEAAEQAIVPQMRPEGAEVSVFTRSLLINLYGYMICTKG
jgi:hypothetical protein